MDKVRTTILTKMRINIFIYFLCIGNLIFSQTPAQSLLEIPISANFEEKTMLEVFDEIEKAYPISFFYKEEWASYEKKNYTFNNTPLKEVLVELLAGKDLQYFPYNSYSILIGRPSDLMNLEGFNFEDFVIQINSLDKKEKVVKREVLSLGDSTLRPLPTQATLRGKVYDYENDQLLAGAQIFFPELEIGVFTDSIGRYALDIPTGNHVVKLSAAGRATQDLQLRVYSDATWNIPFTFSFFQLEEVLLQADSKGQSMESKEAGRVQLAMMDIRRAPPLLGEPDIINTLLSLPGVSSVGEASGGFNVRGGNIDQNLVLQDGNMVFNTSHLLGFYSIFNPDVVKSVSLYKGHIPAQFGGRVSSVLDVDLMEGSYLNHKGKGTVGFLASKFMFNGPIKESTSSYVIAVRGSYPNWVTQSLNNREVRQSSAYYGDALLKLTHKFGDFGKIHLMGYGSHDFFRFSEDFGYNWSTYMGGITWEQIYKNKFSSKIELTGGRYTSKFFNDTGANGSSNQTGLDNFHFKADGQYVPNRSHNIHGGIEATYYNSLDNKVDKFGEESLVLPFSVKKDQGIEMAAYINDEYEINSFIGISVGLRFSKYFAQGPFTVYHYTEGVERTLVSLIDSTAYGRGETIQSYQGLEPRISARVFLDDITSLKLSYNRHNQYLHLLTNTAATTPVDIWQLSNFYAPPQNAHNFSLGVFRNSRGRNLSYSVEGFYRDLSGLLVAKDFATLLAEPRIETQVLKAKGLAYGAEFALKWKSGKWELDASYTYSRSLRSTTDNVGDVQINGGDWFPSDFDAPHNISLSGKFKPRISRTFSFNFIYRSGRPITAPIGSYELFPTWNVLAFSERNQFRIPDYHRLDIAYTFDDGTFKRKKYKTEINLSLFNLYARQNAYSVFFRNQSGRLEAFQLSVLGTLLPMIGYNYRF